MNNKPKQQLMTAEKWYDHFYPHRIGLRSTADLRNIRELMLSERKVGMRMAATVVHTDQMPDQHAYTVGDVEHNAIVNERLELERLILSAAETLTL